MSIEYHFYRAGENRTFCMMPLEQLHPHRKIVMLTETHKISGRIFDKVRASMVEHTDKLPYYAPKPHVEEACKRCMMLRRMPWDPKHGQTAEDEWADDDENWKALERERRERTVD